LNHAGVVEEIERLLRAAGTPERAAQERRYLKSDLEFVGAGLPAVRAVARDVLKAHANADRVWLIGLVLDLWSPSVHELRLTAIILLCYAVHLLEARDIDLIERLLRGSRTWAFVDDLAGDVAGHLLLRYTEVLETLGRWAADDDFWIRRSALLAFLLPLREDPAYFEQFARYSDAMVEEREFFIRKAIGWVLREAGKRYPELVYDWLLPRAGRASGVTVREAIKYLPAGERADVLAVYRAGRKP
jgi:3-methyladenine DNA glycosylase AlkD